MDIITTSDIRNIWGLRSKVPCNSQHDMMFAGTGSRAALRDGQQPQQPQPGLSAASRTGKCRLLSLASKGPKRGPGFSTEVVVVLPSCGAAGTASTQLVYMLLPLLLLLLLPLSCCCLVVFSVFFLSSPPILESRPFCRHKTPGRVGFLLQEHIHMQQGGYDCIHSCRRFD